MHTCAQFTIQASLVCMLTVAFYASFLVFFGVFVHTIFFTWFHSNEMRAHFSYPLFSIVYQHIIRGKPVFSTTFSLLFSVQLFSLVCVHFNYECIIKHHLKMCIVFLPFPCLFLAHCWFWVKIASGNCQCKKECSHISI